MRSKYTRVMIARLAFQFVLVVALTTNNSAHAAQDPPWCFLSQVNLSDALSAGAITGFADDQCTIYFLVVDGTTIVQLNTSYSIVLFNDQAIPERLLQQGYTLLRDLDFSGGKLYAPLTNPKQNRSMVLVCAAENLRCDVAYPIVDGGAVSLMFTVADYGTRILYAGEEQLDRLLLFDLDKNMARLPDLVLNWSSSFSSSNTRIHGAALQVTGSLLLVVSIAQQPRGNMRQAHQWEGLLLVDLSTGTVSSIQRNLTLSAGPPTGLANLWLHAVETGELHVSDRSSIYHYMRCPSLEISISG